MSKSDLEQDSDKYVDPNGIYHCTTEFETKNIQTNRDQNCSYPIIIIHTLTGASVNETLSSMPVFVCLSSDENMMFEKPGLYACDAEPFMRSHCNKGIVCTALDELHLRMNFEKLKPNSNNNVFGFCIRAHIPDDAIVIRTHHQL